MTVVSFFLRVNMSIAIQEMVVSDEGDSLPGVSSKFHISRRPTHSHNQFSHCMPTRHFARHPQNDPRFDWSFGEQTYLNSAYFYGTLLTQLPSGILTDMLGYRTIIGSALCIASVITALVPLVAAQFQYWGVFMLRALTGLVCVSMPALSSTIYFGCREKWTKRAKNPTYCANRRSYIRGNQV